jgi:O-antigen/teichoic acid export membrane protein
VRDRTGKLIEKAREAVPEGTFAVGAGLIVAALTTYVFVIIANAGLDSTQYAAFGAFWGFIFVIGPGLFLPIEQEVGRALAHRRAQDLGGGPLVTRAARLGALLTVVMVVLSVATAPLYVDDYFHGNWLLALALPVGLIGFYVMHLARGTLSGNARFRPYGEILAADGILKLGAALALLAIGVDDAGAYGMALAVTPLLAVLIALRNQRDLLTPGPPASYAELSQALGWLLAGSLLMQVLGYSPLLGINLLKTPSHADTLIVASFTSAFFVARIPPLLFQAVQGTLLPKLANLAGAGRHADFRTGFRQLMMIVGGIAVLGTVGAFAIGPQVGKILFKDFNISHVDLGLLAAGSCAFIVALTVAQALLALKGHRLAAVAWLLGVAAFVAVAAPIPELELRVELGFLAGALVSTLVMALSLRSRMREGATTDVASLISAIEREPLEI